MSTGHAEPTLSWNETVNAPGCETSHSMDIAPVLPTLQPAVLVASLPWQHVLPLGAEPSAYT